MPAYDLVHLFPPSGSFDGTELIGIEQRGSDVHILLSDAIGAGPMRGLGIRGIYSARLFNLTVTTAAIDLEIADIVAAGFNTVMLGLTNNGKGVAWQDPRFLATYRAMRDASIVTPAFDAVQYYIDTAKAHGLKVGAWVQLHYASSSPIHTQWLATPVDSGGPAYNHHLPAYREYVYAYLTEMLTRYPDFDMVELSEAWAFGIWGSGGTGLWETLYAAETGRDYVTDYGVYATGGYVANSGDDSIVDWKMAASTRFAKGMADTIRAINKKQNKHRPVGVYVNTGNAIDTGSGERGQYWVNSGIVDYMNLPIYGDAFSTLNMQRGLHGATDPNGVLMPHIDHDYNAVISFNNYRDDLSRPLNAAEINVKLDALYAEGPACGIIVYFYAGGATTWLDAAQIAAFRAWFDSHPYTLIE